MKKFTSFLIYTISFFFLSQQINAQNQPKKFASGFYKVAKTANSKNSFYLSKTDTYYQLHETGFLSLKTVDTVYDEITDFQLKISIKFKDQENNSLFKFTSRYKAQEIGLLVNGELLLAATIMEPIINGIINYSSNSDKAEIRHIVSAVNYEIKKRAQKKR